ncbi:MAG TPA: type VI secretion system baseplate subunit TssF, partial [Holophaga sp.]|nr:type VI secretion system baseplate subunit TssF [Holophaga sp.]
EPIRVTHEQAAYPVVVDGRNPAAFEVHAITSVTRVEHREARETRCEVPPFYAIRHFAAEEAQPFCWYATREPSIRTDDQGTEVALSLVDLDFHPVRAGAEVLSLDLLCTNRDLPAELPFGGADGASEGFTVPNHGVVKRARVLRKPTPSLRPPSKPGLQWRLISHLCLNQLSLASHGKEALQEMLSLYNHAGSAAIARQIQGIVSVRAQPVTARLPGRGFASVARGVDVAMTFDEHSYAGSCLFLFASILERFLAFFCPPNSFVKFRMSTLQRGGEVAQWPPRAGETALI